MLKEIEKARITLSSDTEVRISMELADEDLVRTLSREEFNEWINPQRETLTKFLKETLQKASREIRGFDLRCFNSIELVGDVNRTTSFKTIIAQAFEV